MNPIESWHKVVKERNFKLLNQILSEKVIFYSPVVHTPQAGKEITLLYLKAASEVFNHPTFTYVNEVIGEDLASLEFTLEINEIKINGLDLIKWDKDNLITEFKVFIRPLKAVQIIHSMMVSMLEQVK